MSNYHDAMRGVRMRRNVRLMHQFVPALFVSIFFMWLYTVPAVRYWVMEIGISLFIDAIVYVMMPLFFIGIIAAIVRNWWTILKEIWRVFQDVRDFMLY